VDVDDPEAVSGATYHASFEPVSNHGPCALLRSTLTRTMKACSSFCPKLRYAVELRSSRSVASRWDVVGQEDDPVAA
jgi:hypothetical protein